MTDCLRQSCWENPLKPYTGTIKLLRPWVLKEDNFHGHSTRCSLRVPSRLYHLFECDVIWMWRFSFIGNFIHHNNEGKTYPLESTLYKFYLSYINLGVLFYLRNDRLYLLLSEFFMTGLLLFLQEEVPKKEKFILHSLI